MMTSLMQARAGSEAMTFLPILERELRGRARGRATYWSRSALALVGLLICLPQLVGSGAWGGVTGPDTFAGPVPQHNGPTDVPNGVDWHPTWTPDSAWIAFQDGTNARWTGDGTTQTGELFMIPRMGGRAVRLANISAGASGRT